MGNPTHGALSKMGRLVDDGGPPSPDDLRTMQCKPVNKGEAMALTLAQMVASARSQAREISPTQAAEAHNNAELALIVDVREPAEYNEGHVPDAVNIPRGVLELRADPASPVADQTLSADQSARVLVYCTKGPGARSLFAAQTLASMGYENVEVLAGGLIAWAEAGLPLDESGQPVA
jgi:rhodanese-related sulfurtransferase